MNPENLPTRAARRLSGYLFELSNRRSTHFDTPPVILGYWPKIRNAGTMKFGAWCRFRSIRLRQYIKAETGAVLDVGHNGFMNDGVHIHATQSIKIGSYVKIGDMVYIYDTDAHPVSPERPIRQKPIVIGHNVWIGAKSIILAGAHIGDHAVIAAGSIVIGEVPPRSVVAGVPARVVRTFEAPDDWVRS